VELKQNFQCLNYVNLVLATAFEPCSGFTGPRKEMRWKPDDGYVPREFSGPTADLSAVELVWANAKADPWGSDLSGRGARPVLNSGDRLGDGLGDAGSAGIGSAAGRFMATEAGGGLDDSLRSGLPVCGRLRGKRS
jgi:hypothetical protein